MNFKKLLVLGSLLSSFAYAETFKLDASHTRFGFQIKHLVAATVDGNFKKFEGTGTFDRKTNKIGEINLTIDPASINTEEPKRDDHLRSPDFFDVAKFKEMTFKSTSVDYVSNKPSIIHGKLTMHGVTKDVALNVTAWAGIIEDPWGNEKLIFQAEGQIDRTHYGLTWNKPLAKVAGFLVGNDVKLIINIEAATVEKKIAEKKEPAAKPENKTKK